VRPSSFTDNLLTFWVVVQDVFSVCVWGGEMPDGGMIMQLKNRFLIWMSSTRLLLLLCMMMYILLCLDH
jgi:hypothetical protein